MAYAKIEQSLSFYFHLLTAPGMVPDSYGPREPGTLVFPNKKTDKDEYVIGELDSFPLSKSFASQKEAYAHMGGIQDGSIILDQHELIYSKLDIQKIQYRIFRAELLPVFLEPSDFESAKFHGALDLISGSSELSQGKTDTIKKILEDVLPELKSPALPNPATEDGFSPVFYTRRFTTMAPEKWEQLRTYNVESDLEGFDAALKNVATSNMKTFAYAAEMVGRQLLLTDANVPDIIVEVRFFSYRETTPETRIVRAPAVLKENLRTMLLDALVSKSDYLDKITERSPGYKTNVTKAINFLAQKLS